MFQTFLFAAHVFQSIRWASFLLHRVPIWCHLCKNLSRHFTTWFFVLPLSVCCCHTNTDSIQTNLRNQQECQVLGQNTSQITWSSDIISTSTLTVLKLQMCDMGWTFRFADCFPIIFLAQKLRAKPSCVMILHVYCFETAGFLKRKIRIRWYTCLIRKCSLTLTWKHLKVASELDT